MAKFGVFDCEKPASEKGYPQLTGLGWGNHIFSTLKEAQEYSAKWLGMFSEDLRLEPNEPFEYFENCLIEIRKID